MGLVGGEWLPGVNEVAIDRHPSKGCRNLRDFGNQRPGDGAPPTQIHAINIISPHRDVLTILAIRSETVRILINYPAMRPLLLLLAIAGMHAQSWTNLFDGKTLNGWQPRATFSAPGTGDWKVQDGAIYCGGGQSGWLSTNTSYKDFQLQLEFKGPADVNSGVFLRSQKDGQPHETGYELQIWDMQPAGYLTGSLVGSVKAPPAPKIKANEWNQFDITAKGDHFLVKMNGKTILDAHDAKHAEGVIGLQCQPKQLISFRNIRIKALN